MGTLLSKRLGVPLNWQLLIERWVDPAHPACAEQLFRYGTSRPKSIPGPRPLESYGLLLACLLAGKWSLFSCDERAGISVLGRTAAFGSGTGRL
jgi:hypothetical protein